MAIEFIISRNTNNSLSVADSKLYINTDGTQFVEVDINFIPVNIQVLSIDNAVISTTDNKIKYTTDNGTTWLDSTGLPNNLFKIEEVVKAGSNIAYAKVQLSAPSYIIRLYKTVDGGATWTYVVNTSFKDFSFYDENNGYARKLGNPTDSIYRTTDGGLTWVVSSIITSLSSFTAEMISFPSGVVYLYGEKITTGAYTLFKSVDFGVTFNEISGVIVGSIKAIDEDNLYGLSSTYLRVSTDGGNTWVDRTNTFGSNFAYFIDITEGYTAQNGVIYKTTDFGLTSSLVPGAPVAGTWFSSTSSGIGGIPGCTLPSAYNYDSNATGNDGSCLFAYKLEDTAGNEADIITETDLSSYVGTTIKINGNAGVCWNVSYNPTNAGAVPVIFDANYVDAAACELSIPQVGPSDPNAYNYDGSTVSDGSELYAYRLVDSRGIENDIVTGTDLSANVGQTITLFSPYNNACYEVAYETDITGLTLVGVSLDTDYVDSPTCELTLPTGYLLTDVAGNAPTIVTDTDLSSYVGQVVKINGARICYLVAVNPNIIGAIPVNVYSSFVDGDSCLLTLEYVNEFECPEDEIEEEEVVPEVVQPKPINLNSYYQSKYKLDQIVREYIIERGEDTEHSYPRLLQLAIHGLRELNLDISASSKMVVLSVKDDMTVDLPEDFVSYSKIAICGQNGDLMSLGHNPKMCLPRYADECGNIVHKGTTQERGSFEQFNSGAGYLGASNYSEGLSSNFRNGELVGRFFGLGGGQNSNGYYRLDKQRGVIQLSSINSTEIVLEYMADITKIDGNFTAHPYIIETIKAYMAWASIRRKLSVPGHEKEMARRDYYNERRIAGLRFSSFTLDEALSTMRTAFRLSPKM